MTLIKTTEYVTIEKAATMLSRNPMTIRRMIDDGKLHAIRSAIDRRVILVCKAEVELIRDAGVFIVSEDISLNNMNGETN